MATLEQRLVAFAQRIRDQFNNIRPRLIPAGGLTNYTLIKAGNGDYQVGWAAPQLTHFCDVSAQDTTLPTDDASAPFVRVPMNQKTSDAENLWDGPNNWYVVPETGLYLINGTFRAPDNAGQFEFGFGIHTVQSDGPYFLWVWRPGVQRWTTPYTRIVYLTAGQQVRMFCYGYQQLGYKVNAASIQIGMISKSF